MWSGLSVGKSRVTEAIRGGLRGIHGRAVLRREVLFAELDADGSGSLTLDELLDAPLALQNTLAEVPRGGEWAGGGRASRLCFHSWTDTAPPGVGLAAPPKGVKCWKP